MWTKLWEHTLASTRQWPRESVLRFGSLGEKHIRQEHISKMAAAELGPSKAGTVCKYHFPPLISCSNPDITQITRVSRNLQCGFKQCVTKMETVYSTTSDLLNHINYKHLEDIKWDCYSAFRKPGRTPPLSSQLIHQYATSTHQMQ